MACHVRDIKLLFQSSPHPSSCPSVEESGCRTLKKKPSASFLLYYSGGSGQILECGWLLTDPTPSVNVNVCVRVGMRRWLVNTSASPWKLCQHMGGGWDGRTESEREWDRGVHNLILGRRYLWPPPPAVTKIYFLCCHFLCLSLSDTHTHACTQKNWEQLVFPESLSSSLGWFIKHSGRQFREPCTQM